MESPMSNEKIHFSEEKETMLVTLYYKALESQAEEPILRDPVAVEAITRIDYNFDKISDRKDAIRATAARATLFDGWVQEYLANSPNAVVLHLGCGLDSRVYRIDPPATVQWFDIDYPDVIELRRRLFPDRFGYQMIGSSVTEPEWLEGIPRDRPALIVAEGLLYYLTEAEVRALLSRLVQLFPKGHLIFDAASHFYLRIQKTNPGISATGARMKWGIQRPDELEQWMPQLKLVTNLSATNADLPNIKKMGTAMRFLIQVMNLIPPVRDMGVMLRYRF